MCDYNIFQYLLKKLRFKMGYTYQHLLGIIYLVWMGLFAGESAGQTELCDDTIILSESSPNLTFSNPFFEDPSSTLNVRVNCRTSFVAVPDGMQVELIFLEVETTNYEGITIYDDQSSTSSTFLIAYLRGTLVGTPTTFSSRGGFTLVYSDSNNAVNGPGYLAQARLVDANVLPTTQSGICGGMIALTDARPTFGFSSLTYDNPTSSSYEAECTLYITSPTGKEIQASLLDTQMINEYVRIYDHPSSVDTEFLVTTLYGTVQARSTAFSSQGGLTLVYSADRLSSHGLGFQAEVSILDGIPLESEGLCGGVIALTDSSPNHTFTTPLYNHPSMASIEMDFTLHILCPEGKQVQLTFLEIETTTNEVILVYEYPVSLSQRFAYIFGSVDSRATVYSSRTGLTIIYQDNTDDYNGRGFVAEARILDGIPNTLHGLVGGTIDLTDTTPNISFYSPLYFQSSSDDVMTDGLIYILAPTGRQVQLTFQDVDTTANEKISIYDHPSSTSTGDRVSYVYGPLQTGVAVFSTQGGLTVVYDDSSTSRNGPGFRAVAQILDMIPSSQSGFCGGTIPLDQSTPTISLSSPLYDKPSIADAHVDCRMKVISPEGKQVRLTFLHIQTTSSESISVYDHLSSLTTRVSYFSGTITSPTAVYSSAGGLTITYDDANDAFNGRGFLAEARILDGLPMNETGFCGGTMSLTGASPKIIFSTPMYADQSTSDINMDCTMNFVGPTGTFIRLIFHNFATTASEEVVVYDHPSTQSATYQVSQLSGPLDARVVFFSTEEGLSLTYIDGSNSFNGPGFTAEAQLLDGVDDNIAPYQPGFCGGTFALTDSNPTINFSSPLYNNPSSAGALVDCKIHVTSPSGKQVRVRFSYIETSDNSVERLTVYDHPSSTTYNVMTVFGTLSSTVTVYSSRGGITLLEDGRYESTSGRGYYAEAQILDSSRSFEPGFCGGTIMLTESLPQINFTTPLYKMSSVGDVEVDCIMSIISESGKQVRLALHNFDTTLNSELRIYDHPSSSSSTNLVSTLYGPLNASAVFLSSQGGLYLLFQDDGASNIERGFLGEASISDPLLANQQGFCGGTAALTDATPSISFSSPLYYNPSINSLYVDCTIHLTSPAERQIYLAFLDIETTTNERISVYDHPTSKNTLIAYLYGTVRTPAAMYSTYGGLTVVFEDRSDAYNGPGFLAEARILELPSYQSGFCGGTMTLTYSTPSVTFSTPIYDNPIVADMTTFCRMYIKAPASQQVKLILRDIETTSNKQITVYDHSTATLPQYQTFNFYGILNGSAIIISTQGGLNLDFNDASSLYSGKGFYAEALIYNFGDISSTEFGFCGGAVELTEVSPLVTFSSPFFGNPSTTDAFLDCTMHIQSSSGEQILLTLFDLNTTANEEVRVSDHPSSATYLVGRFRGNMEEGDAIFVSSRGGFTLIYEDDSDSANGPGFLAQAQIRDSFSDTIPDLCGGVFELTATDPSVAFSTPLYGSATVAEVSLSCDITVNSPSDQQIELILYDIDTAVNGQVAVFDQPSSVSYVNVFTFSGFLNATTTILSSQGSLRMEYDDAPTKGRGFRAKAQISDCNSSSLDGFCGGTVPLTESTPNITLTTPPYGLSSPSDLRLQCTIHITSPAGSQVQLTFRYFETTVHEGITIYDYPSNSNYMIAYFSGKLDAMTTVFSSRGGLTLMYQDDSDSFNGQGYLAEASISNPQRKNQDRVCGGYISLTESFPRVIVTSPLYAIPSVSNVTLNCRWYFSNPSRNKQIEVLLRDVNITEYELISVYNHPYSQSSTYRVASLSGPNDDSLFTSNQFGFVISLQDLSPVINGRGFLIDARLQGTVTTISPVSPVTMEPEDISGMTSASGVTMNNNAVTSQTYKSESTSQDSGAAIETNSITMITEWASSSSTLAQERGTLPPNNTIVIAVSSVALGIIVLVVAVVIILKSRRKYHKNTPKTTLGINLTPPSPPSRGFGSRSRETSFAEYGNSSGGVYEVDDLRDNEHNYDHRIHPEVDHDPIYEDEGHYYALPNDPVITDEFAFPQNPPSYVNEPVGPGKYKAQLLNHLDSNASISGGNT